MIHRNTAIRTRTVVAGCALVATIGISTLASAGGDSAPGPLDSTERLLELGRESDWGAKLRPAPGAEPGGPIDPRERLLSLSRTENLGIAADEMRTAPAPDPEGNAPAWLLVPTGEGGICVDASASGFGFCGPDKASVEAGRASATVYPPDKFLGRDPHTGKMMVRPSDGMGVRYGVGPSEAVEVVVLDPDKRVLDRQAISSEEGLYQVKVPPQGSDALVVFTDASGDTVASRRAG